MAPRLACRLLGTATSSSAVQRRADEDVGVPTSGNLEQAQLILRDALSSLVSPHRVHYRLMRRALRMTWHGLAISLAIVALSLAFVELHGLDLRFSRHGQAWQLAYTDSLLCLGNAPQIAIETKQIQEARDERVRDNDAREAETRHILRREPWRSSAYEAALIKLKELKEGEAALASQEESELASSRSQPIEHEVALRRLIVMTGALPAIWLIMMFLALRRKLKRAGWTRRHVASTALAGLSALVFFALAALWIRSNRVREAVYFNTQEPQRRVLTSTSVSAVDGNLRWTRFEWRYVYQKIYDIQSSLRSTFVPKSSEEPTAPGQWRQSFPIPPNARVNQPFWRRFHFYFSSRSWSVPRVNYPPGSDPRLVRQTTGPPWRQPVTTLFDITIPIWSLMLFCTIWPILWLRKMRRHLFAGPNRCHGCGYDLRASSDRCPECGRPFGHSPTTSRKLSASTGV